MRKKGNIILCGFMASGKTEVGKSIASMTGMPFIDTDELIVRREGESISSIFESRGEAYFRKVEKKIVFEVSNENGAVIALGGGAVLDPDNLEAIRRNGRVYLLVVPLEAVIERTRTSPERPLLQGKNEEELRKLLERRMPVYLEAADVVVDTERKSIEDVAEAIISEFREYGSDP